LLVLTYSLTGRITGGHKLHEEVDIPAPLDPTPAQKQDKIVAVRSEIINHAYGFVSRGNRAGGLAHIQAHIDDETDKDEAYRWYFNEMLKWENTDAALCFAQTCLHRFLSQQRDTAALKLLSQCYHANPRFRPDKDHAEAVIELAERNGRDDLLKLLC